MPAPFRRLSVSEFADRLATFRFTRRIDAVHMHHTWRPNRAMWRGRASIEGMWRYHTQQNGWSDIAQHVTIDPEGYIWTGRDWNQPPASSGGYNGNRTRGPFMFEMIGDFDVGRDRLDGAQRQAVIEVIARVQLAHGLPAESLHFHNMLNSPKTCPGNGPTVQYEEVLEEVRAKREELEQAGAVRRVTVVQAAGVRALGSRDLGVDPAEASAEPSEDEMRPTDVLRYFGGAVDTGRGIVADELTDGTGTARDGAGGFSPEELEALRPHVINLSEGTFRRSGIYETSAADVDAIFEEHLPQWLEATRPAEPLRIVLFAHGGLVGEKDGLRVARKHVDWWKDNGVYPIYFVWETGLFDAMRSVLRSVAERIPVLGRRDLADYTTDPVVEAGCRALGGVGIWGAMKRNAEVSSSGDGGGRYVADRLAAFCNALDDRPVELHAVGHSAGSIFHAHFLPAAREAGVPNFKTLQLLAPAIRVDAFKERLAPQVGDYVDGVTVYTMRRSYEERDTCAGVYRKSLLYLIYNALEPDPDEPILGLEMSLRADRDLKQLFGLDGSRRAPGEVVWSVSEGPSARSASQSTTHGGFDDDAATMGSVAARVLGADAAAAAYRPEGRRSLDMWRASDEWLQGFDVTALRVTPALAPEEGPKREVPAPEPRPGVRQFALCVGIDEYPSANDRLQGCVADTEKWGAALRARGFNVRYLRNREATRDAMRRELEELVSRAMPGDVVVFQYSGHGTQLPDLDGDEEQADDEAFVPWDYETGAFLIDDDVRVIFERLRDGVNLTCFIDCCHSGTITRMLGRNAEYEGQAAGRARYLAPTEAMKKAHQRDREDSRARGAAPRAPVRRSALRWVNFSACQPTEVAYEREGQGDFTRYAMQVLTRTGAGGITHVDFQQRVTEAFGSRRRQTPYLDCTKEAERAALLSALAGVPTTRPEARPHVRPDGQPAERPVAAGGRGIPADMPAGNTTDHDSRTRLAADQLRDIADDLEADHSGT